jgi:O-antigen ligase
VLLASWLIGSASLSRFGPELGVWELFRVVKSLLFSSLLFFVGYWWFQDRTDRTRLLEAMSFGVGILAVAGIADYVFGFTFSAVISGRATGFSGNPNMLGGLLAAFSLVSLYLLRQPEVPNVRRRLHLCVWAVAILTIVLTLSRASWVGVMAGHAVWFLYVNRRILAVGFAVMVLAATVAFPLVPTIIQERVEGTTTKGGPTEVRVIRGAGPFKGSAAFRIAMYRIGAEMLWDSPLWGHGLGSIKVLSPEYGAKYGILRGKSPHSLPLKLAAESGFIGLGVYFWIAFTTLMLGRALWRERDHDYAIGALLLAAGAAILASNLFQTSFFHSHIESAYFWLLYGACARRYMIGDVGEEPAEVYVGASTPALAPSAATGAGTFGS